MGDVGSNVDVTRNDHISLEQMEAWQPDGIMISPGPGTPDQAGISLKAIEHFAGKLPILGVCLGHQAIGQVFGGKIIHAKEIMHGKTSMMHHNNVGVFEGLENPYEATRYHSFVIEKESLPECLEVTAWIEKADGSFDEIMGVRYKTLMIEGVQFHPESILTQHGHDLLKNFLQQKNAVR